MIVSDNIVEKFIKSSIIWGEERFSGNYKLSNKHYDIVKDIIENQKKKSEGWEIEFKPLLNHDNKHVRYSAASFLLPYYEKDAIRVFKKLKKDNLLGLLAKMVLDKIKNEKNI